jgi:hypothetical protein
MVYAGVVGMWALENHMFSSLISVSIVARRIYIGKIMRIGMLLKYKVDLVLLRTISALRDKFNLVVVIDFLLWFRCFLTWNFWNILI